MRFLMYFFVVLLLLTPTARAGELNDAQKKEIEGLIGQVLEDNPELIINSLRQYRAQQEAALTRQGSQAIEKVEKDLYNADDILAFGNLNGDITIVEFFDYQCGYCKRAFGDLMATVKDDGNVRLVLKEFPILGPNSRKASQAALAAHNQGKYFAMHTALMTHRGRVSESIIFKKAKDIGLDVAQLKKDMKSDKVNKILETNLRLASTLKITGTPAFIIGRTLAPGAVSKDDMKKLISLERAKKQKS